MAILVLALRFSLGLLQRHLPPLEMEFSSIVECCHVWTTSLDCDTRSTAGAHSACDGLAIGGIIRPSASSSLAKIVLVAVVGDVVAPASPVFRHALGAQSRIQTLIDTQSAASRKEKVHILMEKMK